MPPAPKFTTTETFTVVCRLEKGLVGDVSPGIIADAAERAHAATRLAQRLLHFHLLRLLEADEPLPAFGLSGWAHIAWHMVTRASRTSEKQKTDAELAATLNACMPDAQPVDSTRLGELFTDEVRRYAVTVSTNIYQHFTKRVQKHVRSVFRIEQAAFNALTKPEKLARRTRLSKIAWDLCSPPTAPRKSDATDHAYIATTRAEWKLDAFPWDGKLLAYHAAANETTNPNKCHAHLLLPAMWHMLRRRELEGEKGFALLPVRTSLVPCHTMFGAKALRRLLGVGSSEFRKDAEREYNKKRKLAALESPGDGSSSTDPVPAPAPTVRRPARPKAVVAAEKRADLMQLFDLKAAGVHACKDKEFDCTFTSDGVAMHMHFSKPKPPSTASNAFPTHGLWSVEELRDRLPEGDAPASIDDIKAPKDKLKKLCDCCVNDDTLGLPFESLICVGCDPGKNEPANLVDPRHPTRKLRMTAAGRRAATNPGNFKMTMRSMDQAEKPGARLGCINMVKRTAAATVYRATYVNKPKHIAELEAGLGAAGCVQTSYLSTFASYVHALKQAESTLVPHYQQVHHRKLRFKAHIERQRFESEFIRDIRRTFDPDRTEKNIVIFWGSWGKVAGRAGGVGNRGLPPTIGVGLAKRIAKEQWNNADGTRGGIVVAWTPEHYTTATHFKCGGKCVRDRKAEARRAVDAAERLGEAEFRHPREIRGLKVCEGCGDHVNRDLNAALNIGTNGLLILAGRNPIRKHTDNEIVLLDLNNEMHSASTP